MWTDGSGFFYEGDKRLADRSATQSEIDAHNLGKLPDLIRIEALKRIDAVIPTAALGRIISFYLANVLTAGEKTGLADGANWLANMQSTAKALIQANDTDYANDAKWPVAPSTFTAVVSKYSV